MPAAQPYILPEGNVAIAFSGGRTSAYMLHQIIEANGLDAVNSDRVVVSFQNTGREMPETLDFVQECGDRWGVRIVWLEYRLRWTGAPHDPASGVFDSAAHSWEVVSHNSASRNGEPFEQVIEYYGYIPPMISRWCTSNLKIMTAQRFCKGHMGWEEWVSCKGIRADEAHRAKTAGVKKDRMIPWFPMVQAGVTKRGIKQFWDMQPFDLRLPNIDGKTPLGNCDLCPLKSERNRAAVARDFPARAEWWVAQEAKYSGTFHKTTPYAELVKMVDRQGDWIFDTEGALCQASDGECTG